MQIEHDITEFVPQPHLIELSRRFVTAAAELAAVSPEAVGRVIVCSEERYGPIIAEIGQGARYTSNETAVGVGKTLPRRVDGSVVSDIVLRMDIFGAFAGVPDGALSPADWPAEVQQIFYAICREFGHARDYALRGELHGDDPRSGPFFIAETAEYYGQIVLTEFAACRNTSSMLTRRLFDLQMSAARKRLQAAQRQANEWLSNPDDHTRRALSHFVCQVAWVFLTELAKLYGDATGQGDLAEEIRTLERELLEETPLTDVLDAYSAAYPAWNTPDHIEELTEVWRRYGRELFAVEFVRRGGGPDDVENVA